MIYYFTNEDQEYATRIGGTVTNNAIMAGANPTINNFVPGIASPKGPIINWLGRIAFYNFIQEDWRTIPIYDYKNRHKDILTIKGETWTVRARTKDHSLIIPEHTKLTDKHALLINVSFESAEWGGWADKNLIQSTRLVPSENEGLFYNLDVSQLYMELPK